MFYIEALAKVVTPVKTGVQHVGWALPTKSTGHAESNGISKETQRRYRVAKAFLGTYDSR